MFLSSATFHFNFLLSTVHFLLSQYTSSSLITLPPALLYLFMPSALAIVIQSASALILSDLFVVHSATVGNISCAD